MRNGFVSAIAMAYNFHLPLILSPNDIWVVVLQGLRVHMGQHKDEAFFKNTIKDFDKIPETIASYLNIKD
jgi:hypothetical protein